MLTGTQASATILTLSNPGGIVVDTYSVCTAGTALIINVTAMQIADLSKDVVVNVKNSMVCTNGALWIVGHVSSPTELGNVLPVPSVGTWIPRISVLIEGNTFQNGFLVLRQLISLWGDGPTGGQIDMIIRNNIFRMLTDTPVKPVPGISVPGSLMLTTNYFTFNMLVHGLRCGPSPDNFGRSSGFQVLNNSFSISACLGICKNVNIERHLLSASVVSISSNNFSMSSTAGETYQLAFDSLHVLNFTGGRKLIIANNRIITVSSSNALGFGVLFGQGTIDLYDRGAILFSQNLVNIALQGREARPVTFAWAGGGGILYCFINATKNSLLDFSDNTFSATSTVFTTGVSLVNFQSQARFVNNGISFGSEIRFFRNTFLVPNSINTIGRIVGVQIQIGLFDNTGTFLTNASALTFISNTFIMSTTAAGELHAVYVRVPLTVDSRSIVSFAKNTIQNKAPTGSGWMGYGVLFDGFLHLWNNSTLAFVQERYSVIAGTAVCIKLFRTELISLSNLLLLSNVINSTSTDDTGAVQAEDEIALYDSSAFVVQDNEINGKTAIGIIAFRLETSSIANFANNKVSAAASTFIGPGYFGDLSLVLTAGSTFALQSNYFGNSALQLILAPGATVSNSIASGTLLLRCNSYSSGIIALATYQDSNYFVTEGYSVTAPDVVPCSTCLSAASCRPLSGGIAVPAMDCTCTNCQMGQAPACYPRIPGAQVGFGNTSTQTKTRRPPTHSASASATTSFSNPTESLSVSPSATFSKKHYKTRTPTSSPSTSFSLSGTRDPKFRTKTRTPQEPPTPTRTKYHYTRTPTSVVVPEPTTEAPPDVVPTEVLTTGAPTTVPTTAAASTGAPATTVWLNETDAPSTQPNSPTQAPTEIPTVPSDAPWVQRTEQPATRPPLKHRTLSVTLPLPPEVRRSTANGAATAMTSIMPPTTATAVAVTGTSTSVAASLAGNPAVAGQAIRASFVLGVADCRYADDEEGPSLVEAPLQMAYTTSKNRWFIGSLMLTNLILFVLPQVLVSGVVYVMRAYHQHPFSIRMRPVVKFFLTMITSLCFSFIGPSVAKLVTFILLHNDGNVDAIVVAVLNALASLVVILWVFRQVYTMEDHVEIVPEMEDESEEKAPSHEVNTDLKELDTSLLVDGDKEEASKEKSNNHQKDESEKEAKKFKFRPKFTGATFIESYAIYFDPARDPRKKYLRVVFFVELLVGVVLGIIDGIRPDSGTCVPIAGSMLVVCFLMFLYSVGLRPYRTRLDTFFSAVGASLTLVIACLAVAVTANQDDEHATDGLGTVGLLLNIHFIAQSIVCPGWGLYRKIRRRYLRRKTPLNDEQSNKEEKGLDEGGKTVQGHSHHAPAKEHLNSTRPDVPLLEIPIVHTPIAGPTKPGAQLGAGSAATRPDVVDNVSFAAAVPSPPDSSSTNRRGPIVIEGNIFDSSDDDESAAGIGPTTRPPGGASQINPLGWGEPNQQQMNDTSRSVTTASQPTRTASSWLRPKQFSQEPSSSDEGNHDSPAKKVSPWQRRTRVEQEPTEPSPPAVAASSGIHSTTTVEIQPEPFISFAGRIREGHWIDPSPTPDTRSPATSGTKLPHLRNSSTQRANLEHRPRVLDDFWDDEL